MNRPDSHNNTSDAFHSAEPFLAELKYSYRTARRKQRACLVIVFTALFLGGFSLLTAMESQLYLTPAAKIAGWLVLLSVSAGAALITAHLLPKQGSGKGDHFTRFYRSFCETYGFTELENALDLYLAQPAETSPLHRLAIEKNVQQTDAELLKAKLREFRTSGPVHTAFLTSAGLFILSLAVFIAGPIFQPDAAQRSLSFWTEFEKPNPYHFTVVPGDTTLEHGSRFTPEIIFSDDDSPLPQRVTLAIKTDVEEEYRHRPMNAKDNRTYRAQPVELTGDATYRILMDDHQSGLHDIAVQLRPRFETLTVTVDPPSYTGLPSRELDYPFAQLNAYGGSEIKIRGVVNKPAETIRAVLSGDGSEPVEMSADDDDSLTFSASFHVSENDTVRFRMVDADGLRNRNPFHFNIRLLEDEHPIAVIHEPDANISLAEPEQLDIIYQAADDFGLTRAELHWELRRAFAEDQITGSRPIETPQIGEAELVQWDLQELDLRPRDKISFWITVWDNDQFNGYKPGRSQQITVTVPSVSAQLEEIDRKERGIQDAMDDISEQFRTMEREYDRFKERLKENPEPGWEEDQMLDELQGRQEEIDESVRRLNEQFEEIRREMESSGQVSEETQRAYRELQELIEQIDDPELQKALDELRRSMQDMDIQQIQQALEEFEFNENVYRERLERTLELFKTLKMNSDLDKLAAQYEDLAERMNEAAQEDKSPREQFEDQQGVREDTDAVDRQLEQLDSRPPKRSEEQLRQLRQEAQQELHDIQQQLDEMIRQGQSGEEGMQQESGQDNGRQGQTEQEEGRDELRQQQQQISRQFQQRAESLRSARQQMSGQQIQVNLLALQQSLYSLLEISESQEELTERSGQTANRSHGFVELARMQKNIQNQFNQIADTLFQVSSELPSLSNNINRKKADVDRTLSQSVDMMAEREQRRSVVTSRESLGGINDLASMLAQAIDQLIDQQGEGEGGGGSMTLQQMIEQMQNMSGDQEMLNRQLQELINDMQGERLSQEQSERLDQLARQQNEIRKQLERLQRSGALREGDRTLSELQRMTEQMEDAINDLRGGMTDPLMIERQQNILSRMLQTEESLQERGQADDEYEGRRADDFERALPPDITLEELKQEIRTRLRDPDYTRFSDDYQQLIERYFELLRQFEERPLP